jgi:hypothetical protein
MPRPCLIFLGDFSSEKIAWNDVGRHVDWIVRHEHNPDSLRELHHECEVVGVFVECSSEGLTDVLRLKRIQALAPDACVVACRPLDLMEATESDSIGAFHVIALPLEPGELRQSIGFVWESWSRRAVPRAAASAGAPSPLKYVRIA